MEELGKETAMRVGMGADKSRYVATYGIRWSWNRRGEECTGQMEE